MTNEEKAKRYDEALERAKGLIEGTREDKCDIMEEDIINIFPELKESEDEKIRKSLLSYLHGLGEFEYPDKKTYNGWISWLEKQGEQKPIISNNALREGIAHFGITQYQIDNWLKKYVDVEKQGEQKSDSEDERLTDFEKSVKLVMQEAIDEGDTHNFKADADMLLRLAQKSVSKPKQGVQKHTDKVEPKFKVGDWITNGDYTWKIVEVLPLDYILQSQDGNMADDTISYVDEQFHSFTIEDAKDGDVLVIESDRRNNECLFIFKDIACKEVLEQCYYRTSDNTFSPTGSYIGYLDNIYHPATKEQHKQLFDAMHKAGYEWDAVKKELKKIEQKPVEWNEDDETLLQYAIDGLTNYIHEHPDPEFGNSTPCEKAAVRWLKSLKERFKK